MKPFTLAALLAWTAAFAGCAAPRAEHAPPEPPSASASEVTEAVVFPQEAEASRREDGPRKLAIARDHWQPLHVGPADGTTRHQPKYFGAVVLDSPAHRPDFNRPTRQDGSDVEANILAALDGEDSREFFLNDLQGYGRWPLRFSLDAALSGPRMLLDPPWREHRTPAE